MKSVHKDHQRIYQFEQCSRLSITMPVMNTHFEFVRMLELASVVMSNYMLNWPFAALKAKIGLASHCNIANK